MDAMSWTSEGQSKVTENPDPLLTLIPRIKLLRIIDARRTIPGAWHFLNATPLRRAHQIRVSKGFIFWQPLAVASS